MAKTPLPLTVSTPPMRKVTTFNLSETTKRILWDLKPKLDCSSVSDVIEELARQASVVVPVRMSADEEMALRLKARGVENVGGVAYRLLKAGGHLDLPQNPGEIVE